MVFVPSLEVTNLIDSLYHNELYPGSMLWVWALKHLMFHHGQDQLKYKNQVDPWYRSKNSAKLQIWLPFRNFLWIQWLGQGIIFEMGISGDPNHLCFSSNRLNTQPIVVEVCLEYWMMPVLLGSTLANKIRKFRFLWSERDASRETFSFVWFKQIFEKVIMSTAKFLTNSSDVFTNLINQSSPRIFSVFLLVQNSFFFSVC